MLKIRQILHLKLTIAKKQCKLAGKYLADKNLYCAGPNCLSGAAIIGAFNNQSKL